jgi:hypothetical protein
MTLEQIAQQAMDYLDSVGVAADWDIVRAKVPFTSCINILYVYTSNKAFSHIGGCPLTILGMLKNHYPTSKE